MDTLNAVFGETVPYIQEHDLGTEVNEERSRGGLTVTVKRVYADPGHVVIGYTVKGLGKFEGPSSLVNTEARLGEPAGGGDGTKYDMVDGIWQRWSPGDVRGPVPPKGSEVGTVVFEASDRLEPGTTHDFRLRVDAIGPSGPVPQNGTYDTEPLTQPFFVDVRAPVRPAPVIKVNQTREVDGVPITLTHVVNSPAKTSAYLCFDPPQRKYDEPLIKTHPFEQGRLADAPVYHIDYAGAQEGCAQYTFDRSLYGRPGTHSLTITKLYSSTSDSGEAVRGPWRFSFEVPR